MKLTEQQIKDLMLVLATSLQLKSDEPVWIDAKCDYKMRRELLGDILVDNMNTQPVPSKSQIDSDDDLQVYNCHYGWLAMVDLKMDNGDLVFTRGCIYHEIGRGDSWINLINNHGCKHNIDIWLKCFKRVK